MADKTTTEAPTDPDAWMRDPDKLEQFIVGAIEHRDWKAVEYALMQLAVVDANRAARVHDTIRLGLAMRGVEVPRV